MSSFRRRLMNILERELPYIELDYIESTGTQYIDTGYVPTINTDIKTRASVQYNSTDVPVALFGYLKGSNTYNRYAVQYSTRENTSYVFVAKGKTESSVTTIDYTKMCDIETQGSNYIYDGTTISVAPLDFSVSNTLSIILFARQTTSVNRHSKARMEYFRIYENNQLIQYLIPVIRKLDGKVCMYNKISKQFFENEGTGEFIPGTLKDLPEGYAQLDYLESTGTQYIDTGIVFKQGDDIQFDTTLQYTRNNLDYQYMGTYGGLYFGAKQKYYNFTKKDTTVAVGNKDNIKFIANTQNGNAEFYINGELIDTNNRSYQYGTICLFDLIGYSNFKCYVRLYNFSIIINDTIVRYFVPCLDANGVACMYDIINGISYYNQGTGEFIVGSILKYSLPTKYKECKWLQGDLNSYIDTGILPNNNTSAEVKFTVTDLKNTRPLGVTDGKNRFSIVLPNVGTGYLVNQIGTTNKIIESKQMSVGETATIKNDKGKLYYNGSLVDTVTPNTFNIDMPIFIAAQNSWTGTISALDKSLIEYVKLWKNNILVMYMVPCLDENNVPCMYDLVRRQTFYNSGNGEFLYELKED